MPYRLEGNCVVLAATGKPIPGGCHDSHEEALKHLAALQIHMSAKERLSALVHQAEPIARRLSALVSRAEIFDLRGVGKPGAKRKEIVAVNDYQGALESAYSDWADDTARKLADAAEKASAAGVSAPDDTTRQSIIDTALAALLLTLLGLGRDYLPDAIDLGLDDDQTFPGLGAALDEALQDNEDLLENSLIPDIGAKLRAGLMDGDIAAALAAGTGVAALAGLLDTVTARVGQYAGEFWALYNDVVGKSADQQGQGVRWILDPSVRNHCDDCLQWGDHDYASYESMLEETGGLAPAEGVICGSNCRCYLETAGG